MTCKINFSLATRSGVVSSRERASLGFGVQTLEYNNSKKKRKRKVGPLGPRRI